MLFCHLSNDVVLHIPATVQMQLASFGVYLVRLDFAKIQAFFKKRNYLVMLRTLLRKILSEQALQALEKSGATSSSLLVVVKTCQISGKYDGDFIFREAQLHQYLFEKEPKHIVPLAFKQTRLYFARWNRVGTELPAKVTLYQSKHELPRSMSQSSATDNDDDGSNALVVQKRIVEHMETSGLAQDIEDEDWCLEHNIINGSLYHDFGRNVLLKETLIVIKKRKKS